jgi:plasmid stabilization system protein ParE
MAERLRRVTFLARARRDLREGYAWYEAQRHGLGDSFFLATEECLERIRRMPEAYAILLGDARRVLVRRYPYAIIYRIRPDRIVIVAVVHTHRHPAQWEKWV